MKIRKNLNLPPWMRRAHWCRDMGLQETRMFVFYGYLYSGRD